MNMKYLKKATNLITARYLNLFEKFIGNVNKNHVILINLNGLFKPMQPMR